MQDQLNFDEEFDFLGELQDEMKQELSEELGLNSNENCCNQCNCTVSGTMKPCPFKEDLNADQTPCNCCEQCRMLCAEEL